MSDLTGLSQAALSKIIADQQARIEELEEVAQRRLEYIDKKNERIEELKAANKDALEYLQREGTPYVNAAIAALQENNDE